MSWFFLRYICLANVAMFSTIDFPLVDVRGDKSMIENTITSTRHVKLGHSSPGCK